MKISSDYRDLLRNFNEAGVRYLVVGGYADMVHTEPHWSKDLDLWIDRSEPNAAAVFAALSHFGAPLTNIRPTDFLETEVFYQLGVEPVRIDVLTSVPGLDFSSAWDRRVMVDFNGESVPVLSREDLYASSKSLDRPKDRKRRKRLEK